MFADINDIYTAIGQEIYNQMPEKWDKAWLEVLLVKQNHVIAIGGYYIQDNHIYDFDIFEYENEFTQISKAFYSLHDYMSLSSGEDMVWNKCYFTLFPDGEFDVQFKMDLDYKWYNNLDPDGDEFDALDIDIIDKIESWEGLPADFDRYWLK